MKVIGSYIGSNVDGDATTRPKTHASRSVNEMGNGAVQGQRNITKIRWRPYPNPQPRQPGLKKLMEGRTDGMAMLGASC